MKNSKLGKFFAYLSLGVISIGVLMFLGRHSLNFFTFTFKDDDQLFAWLGLLLTSGGVIGWLAIFLWLAETTIQKGVSLIMMAVALAGEMITAVFDMQNSALYSSGFQFLPQELKTMTEIIGYLGALTGLALIAYGAGDRIIEAFGDHDGDGVPNYKDRDYKPKKKWTEEQSEDFLVNVMKDSAARQGKPFPERRAPHPHSNNGNTPRTYTLDGLLQALRMDRAEFKSFLMDTETFTKAWQVLRNDGRLPKDITHRNFNELCGQVNPIPAAR